jgi:hypothetical protein
MKQLEPQWSESVDLVESEDEEDEEEGSSDQQSGSME